MKKIRSFGFTAWYVIIAATSITAYLDYESWSIIQDFGGFSAWTTKNPLWDTAAAYLAMWHFFYAVTLWFIWYCAEDYNEKGVRQ